MLPHEGKKHDNIIAHIQIGQTDDYSSSCNIALQDVNRLAGGADLRDLTFVHEWAYQTDTDIALPGIHSMDIDQTEGACGNLENLGSLAIMDSQITPERILELISCAEVYPQMAEIRLKNIAWTFHEWNYPGYTHKARIRLEPWDDFWDKLKELFPNLQSLSLPHNKLDRIPDAFPWTTNRYQLPRNLSRTKYTDDQYVHPYYLLIPPNNYKRVLNLDNNSIRNLMNFRLNGCLDMITMVNSEINVIGEHVFEDVSCLQSLRLGYNHITDLPPGLFRNMTHLRELDLSHNMIKSLNETTFYDLMELESLNLAHNYLEFLPPGLFTKLQRLRYIHLESNLLTSLTSQSFPNNKLDRIPDAFPWTTNRYQLPRNLSRTKYTDDQYVHPYHLLIPRNNYKRVLNLDNNSIRNLMNFRLNGCLDMITMVNSEINVIGEHVFEDVSCLQSLRLGYNHITDLPPGLFRNMIHLHELDLSHNMIKSLNATIFDDLMELESLNLAHNYLEFLPPGLFTKLQRLRYIHLESNLLTSLTSQSFPIESLAFEKLFVDGNYITTVPEFAFTTPGLAYISLTHNEITNILPNTTAVIVSMQKQKSMAFSDNDLDEGIQMHTTIDLSNNHIRTFNSTIQNRAVWSYVLQNFRVVLSNNPIKCDCTINEIVRLMNGLKGTDKMSNKYYEFLDWTCTSPLEHKGRPVINITGDETCCIDPNMSDCPPECDCCRRSNNQSTIVDCRSRHIKGKIHDRMPSGHLELWYSHNCISEIPTYSPNSYMERVIVLNVSNNKVKNLSEELFHLAHNLETLDIRSNHLTNIPNSIGNLRNLKWASLTGNDLVCDCHSESMKNWVMENKKIVYDWNETLCITSDGETKPLEDTTEEDFKCTQVVDKTNYTPLFFGSAALVISLIVAMLVLFRLECKVLLYMYFGLHPFDRKDEKRNEVIDCLIVHSHKDTEWVKENIIKQLESPAYRFVVFDQARDFLLGYSIHENLTNIVRHSKRVIICLSTNWNPSSVDFKLVWNSVVQKIKETRSNYGVVICKGVSKKNVRDKSLCKYIKADRFINSTERLFIPKLVYAMPSGSKPKRRRRPVSGDIMKQTYPDVQSQIYPTLFERLTEESTAERSADEYDFDVFISNSHDSDTFTVYDLTPMLESRGYKVCLPGRDLLAGPTKEESILTAIYRSRRTLIILSEIHLNDEWSLFTYKKAYERSLREKTNHLMVVIKDDTIEILDEEVQCYLNDHVTLSVNDTYFENKLLCALPILQKGQSVSIAMDMEANAVYNTVYTREGDLLDNDELAETHVDI